MDPETSLRGDLSTRTVPAQAFFLPTVERSERYLGESIHIPAVQSP